MARRGGVIVSGFSGNVRGAHGDFSRGVGRLFTNFQRMSRRFFSSLRRALVSTSIKFSVALTLSSMLHSRIGVGGIHAKRRIGGIVVRGVIRVCRGNRARLPAVGVGRGKPAIVLFINMGKIKGAAAVKGCTCRLGGRKGDILLTTKSAFQTKTVRRLRI